MRSEALTEAISRMTQKYSFWAILLFDLLTIKETEEFPTAATDGKTLFINPNYFGELTLNERVFLLSHEVLHVVLEHCPRNKLYIDRGFGPDLKKYDPRKMNYAQDYIINDWLVQSGLRDMPTGGLLNPQYGMNEVADEVYCKLPDPPPPPPPPPRGNGQPCDGDDGTTQEGFDVHLPQAGDPPTKADVQRALKSAESVAKSQGQYNSGMGRLVDGICEPQVDWAEQIRLSVSQTAGKDDYTWARPNRKRLVVAPHVYLPGTCSHKAGVVVLVEDSSGSVSDRELKHYRGEMAAIVDELNPEETWISDCSTRCPEFLPVESADDVIEYQPRESGGTFMPDIFRQVEEQGVTPDVVVICTDGYTDFGEAPPYDVIWVMTTDREAPYGRNIRIQIAG
jgi:predicted metal-dependent peptidase